MQFYIEYKINYKYVFGINYRLLHIQNIKFYIEYGISDIYLE